jgi:hypothetical protein
MGTKMNHRKYAVSIPAILILSCIMITPVFATTWSPSLPTDSVTIEIMNLTYHEYPFSIELSNVNSGVDVANNTYEGWCVDAQHNSDRGVKHSFMLYSSYDVDAPFPAEEWDMINYILNNKLGTGADVQAAIWYFVNARNYYWPTSDYTPSTETETMVANALAEGEGYIPGEGDYFAIVAIPTDNALLQKMVIVTVVPNGAEPEPTSEPEPSTNPQQSPTSSSEPGTTPEPEPSTNPQHTPTPSSEPTDSDTVPTSASGEFPLGLAVTAAIIASSVGIGLTVYFRGRRHKQEKGISDNFRKI